MVCAPRGLYICVREREAPVVGTPAAPMHTRRTHSPLRAPRNPMPNRNEGMIVRGRPTRRARLTEATIELPEQPVRASFFAVQEDAGDATR